MSIKKLALSVASVVLLATSSVSAANAAANRSHPPRPAVAQVIYTYIVQTTPCGSTAVSTYNYTTESDALTSYTGKIQLQYSVPTYTKVAYIQKPIGGLPAISVSSFSTCT